MRGNAIIDCEFQNDTSWYFLQHALSKQILPDILPITDKHIDQILQEIPPRSVRSWVSRHRTCCPVHDVYHSLWYRCRSPDSLQPVPTPSSSTRYPAVTLPNHLSCKIKGTWNCETIVKGMWNWLCHGKTIHLWHLRNIRVCQGYVFR